MTNRVESTGRWEKYQYDNIGRLTNKVVQFGDNAPSTANSSNRVTQISYTTNGLITTIENLLDTEIGRTYEIHAEPQNGVQQILTIRCAVAGAATNDSVNLTNIIWRTTDTTVTGTAWEKLKELNPDGTMAIYTNRTDFPQSGQKTKIVKTGAPNVGQDDIMDGTQTTTVVGQWGQVLTNEVLDIASDLVVDRQIYFYSDSLYRSYTVSNLDVTTESFDYACCGLDTQIDRDAVMTQFFYDAAKRQVASARLGITTTNLLDAAGHTLKSIRIGSTNSQIQLRAASYGTDGNLLSETNALDGVTTYSYGTNSLGETVVTNTYADGGTRIETRYQDGNTKSVTGTAEHGVRYEYGVDSDGAYTKEIKLNSDGTDTSEWTKSYVDMLGRSYKTVYAAVSGTPFSISHYNQKGQLTNEVDPDGVTTIFQYNAKGEQEYTAVDMNQNSVIDFGGTDRITRTVSDVTTDNSVNVRRLRTYVWSTASSDVSNLVSVSESSVDGLRSWQTQYRDASTPVTSQSQTVYSGTSRYVTNTAPDGSFTVNAYVNGRLSWVKRCDASGGPLTRTDFAYDEHGHQSTVTDARNGATTYGYNDADLVTSVITPSPGGGGSAQTTLTYYNKMLQATNVVQPDGTSVTSEFFTNGELKKIYGSRTYPVEYSYDYAGRMKTMKTWTNYAGDSGTATTTWNYDSYRGFLTNKVYEGGAAGPAYTYTAGGKLQTRTWARGITTDYGYNAAGDLATVVYSDGITANLTNSYDRRGRLTQQSTASSQLSCAYNDANQLLSESYSGGTLDGLAITNGYDQFLRRTNLSVLSPSSQLLTSTAFGYDNASRLSSVSDGTNGTAYTYLANSPLISQITFKSNGVTRMTTTKSYDYLNRLTQISSVNSQPSNINSFSYAYNSANQRNSVTNWDNSRWLYDFDSLGQVTSGKKYWADGTPVAGQQFEYTFDDIGNRTQTKSGGDENGSNLRTASYSANNLNQYTSRDIPGYVDIFGVSFATNTVTVNGQTAYRKGEYFRKELAVANDSAALWTNITVAATGQSSVSGNVFVVQTPETFGYDADGNMTNDGRWVFSWDAENRLVQVESLISGPTASKRKVVWEYDGQGRRIRQTVHDLSSGDVVTEDLKFVSDGWRNIAELNATNNALVRSYVWGLDLSGSMDGAGGIGGLLILNSAANGGHFFAYDGNGNVAALVNAGNGTSSARYEYDPFGQTIRATGLMAKENPFRFSTKRADNTTDFVLYEYRIYSPSLGRWLNRDPVAEKGGCNLNGYLGNDALNRWDFLGRLYGCCQIDQTLKQQAKGAPAFGVEAYGAVGLGFQFMFGTSVMFFPASCEIASYYFLTDLSGVNLGTSIGAGLTQVVGLPVGLSHGSAQFFPNANSWRGLFYTAALPLPFPIPPIGVNISYTWTDPLTWVAFGVSAGVALEEVSLPSYVTTHYYLTPELIVPGFFPIHAPIFGMENPFNLEDHILTRCLCNDLRRRSVTGLPPVIMN